jgi:LuxR family transcriptional regulator, maltose regulon positive regulatory protein
VPLHQLPDLCSPPRATLLSAAEHRREGATLLSGTQEKRTGPVALAATKFLPPHAPAAMVRRPRLTERLEAGARAPLTLVAAPAGAGKSALLSTWVADRTASPTAWLSLDPVDDDRRRFWRGVLEALRRANLGEPIDALMVQPDDDAELVLPALVNALEQRDEPVVLVIDDLHEIGAGAALRDLDRLLRHPSPALRIVVATRVDPPLRVGRMRVAGELTEIRAADLAFTLEETEELLAVSGIDVPAQIAETLWQRTEGWAAGLRLAALTMRSHPDPSAFVAEFAGDDSTVADYLLAEVLAQQSPDVREYLLRLSIVGAANAELADALTGRTDSARILAQLERDHALLSSAGETRWHRLHPLFAELLRSELRYQAADEIPELERRAARWFAAHERPLEAIRHAAAAGDWDHVGEVAGGHWVRLLLEGELDAVGPVLERMPDEVRRRDPEVALAVAGVHVSAGDEPAARHWFELARAGRERVPADRRAAFDHAIAAVGLMRGRLRGDPDAAMQHARTMLERDGSYDGGAAPDDLRALAMTELGIAELWSGDLERARRDLETARGAAAAAGRDWLRLLATAYLGVEAMLRGRLERATRLALEAEALAHRRGWGGTWPMGITAVMLSAVAFQRDRLDEAEDQINRAADRLRASGDRPLRAVSAFQRARMLAARGQPEPALETLQEARGWLDGWPIMPAVGGLLTGLEATVVAAAGDVEDADAVLDGNTSDEVAVVRARLRLRAGDPAAALAVLSPHLDGAGPALRTTRIEAWVVSALAADALADAPAAAAALERALDGAEAGGITRPFLMHGASIAPLLRRHRRAAASRHRALLDDLLGALDQRGDDRPVATLPEPLSEREAAVLSFLPTMLSNQEIAAELFVSVNTVKTHLKAIYRKLDVDDRRSAVRRARELTLLGPR